MSGDFEVFLHRELPELLRYAFMLTGDIVGGSTHPMLEGAWIADPALGIDERDAMWQHLAGLPRQQRAVLVLRFYEGLSDAEIADILHCTAGTVRSHASRALGTLRAQLTQSTDLRVDEHQEHR